VWITGLIIPTMKIKIPETIKITEMNKTLKTQEMLAMKEMHAMKETSRTTVRITETIN
jgi:hypothetical protein